jgi:hypothetical protein
VATNDEINRNRDFILSALDWGIEAEKWTEVVRVAQAVDRGIALGRHWGAWQQVLEHGLKAAEQLGPAGESAKAWALHQMGSRAIGIGDDVTALANLSEALDIRKRLGETEAIEVTKHNLHLDPLPLPIRPGTLGGALAGALLLVLLLLVKPPDWTNGVEFNPEEITFSGNAVGVEWIPIELVNETDRDVSGIQLSVSPATGEFTFRAGTAAGSALTDTVPVLALDMPLAAASTIGAEAPRPCDLDANNVLEMKKKTRCSLEVGFTGSQTGVVKGTLHAQVGDESVVSALQVSEGPIVSPPIADTTESPPPPDTTEFPPITDTTDSKVLPGGETATTTTTTASPALSIIDIAHEVVVFESDRPQQILVTNVGTAPVTIEGLLQPEHFSAAGCVGDPLGVGETCTLVVTFADSPGLYCEILELVFDGAGERQVFLKGGD